MEEAHSAKRDLAALVGRVLELNEDIAHRLARIEKPDIMPPSTSTTQAQSVASVEDETSTIKPAPAPSDHSDNNDVRGESLNNGLASNVRENLSFGFTFDRDLECSRVYQRAFRYNSSLSLPSSGIRSMGWSFLSGLSLADISRVSVLCLPIAVGDLSNPQHYSPGGKEGKRNRGLGYKPQAG